MKKIIVDLKEKSIKELEKEINLLRQEISKSTIEGKINPVKNTNELFFKKKKLARLLTVLNEKKTIEKIKIKK